IDSQVKTHGDTERVEKLANPDDMSGTVVYQIWHGQPKGQGSNCPTQPIFSSPDGPRRNIMEIQLNYQPKTAYKGYEIEVATGIGGHYARTIIKDGEETYPLEVGPNDTEKGALQSIRRSVQDTLYAIGY